MRDLCAGETSALLGPNSSQHHEMRTPRSNNIDREHPEKSRMRCQQDQETSTKEKNGDWPCKNFNTKNIIVQSPQQIPRPLHKPHSRNILTSYTSHEKSYNQNNIHKLMRQNTHHAKKIAPSAPKKGKIIRAVFTQTREEAWTAT